MLRDEAYRVFNMGIGLVLPLPPDRARSGRGLAGRCLPLWDGSNRVRASDWTERVSTVKRLTILISGNGSNLEALIEACGTNRLPAEVGLVISSKGDGFSAWNAPVGMGVPAKVLSWSEHRACGGSRSAYDQQLAALCGGVASRPDCACGMDADSDPFLSGSVFPGRWSTFTPALPGAFSGAARH